MCLKSITPIAKIRMCMCKERVCVSPKDVITMVIQKPVDYVVVEIWLIYTLPLVIVYTQRVHTETEDRTVLYVFAMSVFQTGTD